MQQTKVKDIVCDLPKHGQIPVRVGSLDNLTALLHGRYKELDGHAVFFTHAVQVRAEGCRVQSVPPSGSAKRALVVDHV